MFRSITSEPTVITGCSVQNMLPYRTHRRTESRAHENRGRQTRPTGVETCSAMLHGACGAFNPTLTNPRQAPHPICSGATQGEIQTETSHPFSLAGPRTGKRGRAQASDTPVVERLCQGTKETDGRAGQRTCSVPVGG